MFGRDVSSAPLRLLMAATYVVSVIGLFTVVLVVTELVNVLPVFYFNIVSWSDALLFVLAVALWYWLTGFLIEPRVMRAARAEGRAARWAGHVAHLVLLFAVVHVLNNLVFVHGILISTWSEVDYVLICHALVWLLWRGRGRSADTGSAGAQRAS